MNLERDWGLVWQEEGKRYRIQSWVLVMVVFYLVEELQFAYFSSQSSLNCSLSIPGIVINSFSSPAAAAFVVVLPTRQQRL